MGWRERVVDAMLTELRRQVEEGDYGLYVRKEGDVVCIDGDVNLFKLAETAVAAYNEQPDPEGGS